MENNTRQSKTFDLFAQDEELANVQDLDWPPQQRFPLNNSGYHVEDIVIPDLVASSEPLIVTGYASLDRIIDVCYQIHAGNRGVRTRLLIGQEPYPSLKESFTVSRPDLCSATAWPKTAWG